MYASSTNFVTFNPGPSQLSPKIIQAVQDIARSGFLSQSHRSAIFSEVSERAIEGMRKQMRLPSDYHIFYQPSATAAMDTLLRNLVFAKSYHFVNGTFSAVFHHTAQDIGLEAQCFESPLNRSVAWESAIISKECELIALTHNETSTGVMWPREEIYKLRNRYPDSILAVDVTSTFGTMAMQWTQADVWFGAVQKCLGLPPGLGFLIVGPRAFDRAKRVFEAKKGVPNWQRFDALAEKMRQYQTPETPNLMNIALLAQQMADWNLEEQEAILQQKAKLLYEAKAPWKPFVVDVEWRSTTVLNMAVDDPNRWHTRAKSANMILGEGYGPLKNTCIRIANFPAITLQHIQKLIDLFS